jgi:predicted PurR-regulated permease PerM
MGILLGRIARLWLAFIRGQLTLMLVVGVVTWLGLIALGVRGSLYLGAAAGLLEIVPNLGPVISTALGAVLALQYGSSYLRISNPVLAVVVIVFYVLVQQLENIFIVPRVMGDALKLPALVVLLGIAVGAALAGVPGAVLATPLIATARELERYYRRKRRGEDPFPDKKAAP